MMKKFTQSVLTVALAVGLSASAWAEGGREKLSAFFTDVDTLQASFTQQVVDAKGAVKQLPLVLFIYHAPVNSVGNIVHPIKTSSLPMGKTYGYTMWI